MTQKSLKVYSPYNRDLIVEYPMNSVNDVDNALQTAYDIANDHDRTLPIPDRKRILKELIKVMSSKYDKIVTDSAQEGGKPYLDTKIEVDRALQGIEVAIESISGLKGTEIPMNQNASSLNRMAYTYREPIGVVVAVSAFNHPVNLIVHQVVPAIATGCPVIVKPASTTPTSCFNVVESLYDAGLPEDWAKVLITDRVAATKLVTDKRVSFFSFIGSGEVGWKLRSMLAPGVTCAMEHGGVAPVIFEPDADIDDAIPLLAKGGFYHAGQVCVSVQRLFVHDSIVDDVSSRLTVIAKKLIVGDPVNPKTEVGPLIQPSEVDRVENWVNEAVEKGAKLLCGGKRISETCYEPTVLLDPPDDCTISKFEVFGPVVCIYSYSDRLDAIKCANSLPYSFQASVFTKNIDIAMDTSRRLNATAVMINDHTAFRVDWMPFGGRKESGMGMGGIPQTMHDMTAEKMIVIRSSAL